MKTLLAVSVAVFAISVPVALADDNPPPSTIGSTPSGQTQTQGDRGGNAGARVQMIQARVRLIAQRFAKRCGTDSTKAPQECVDFAKKAADRVSALDTKVQALIAKRQQAGKDVTPLTKLDTALQALADKIHAWLGS